MSKCHNKNTAEYQSLKQEYGTDAATGNIIDQYQAFTKTDTIPTVAEAIEFITNKQTLYNLKQLDFGQSLLNNLRRLSIIHSFQGKYFINNTDRDTLQPSNELVEANRRRLERYLDINNIPAESVLISKTPKTYTVSIDSSMFSPIDMLESSRAWDKPRTRHVVMHLMKLIPGLNVSMKSVSEAKALYEKIPQWRKSKVPFDQINSFYVENNVILIKGRVTDEIAIEEVLHPFVEAVRVSNIKLFEGLLSEAGKTFPVMKQQIDDAYNSKRNVSAVDREMELITQALSRHYNNEYEEAPPQSFMDKIRELLEWLSKIIKNLNEVITGRTINIDNISERASLSDIAKLLNTTGIVFNIDTSQTNGKVKYNLSPRKQKVVDGVKGKSNELQKRIIDRLTHKVNASKQEADSLSVSAGPEVAIQNSDPLVILNKKDGKFYNLTNRKEVKSVSDVVGRKKESQKTIEVKQDISLMLDAIAIDESFESIQDKLIGLTPEFAQNAFNNLVQELQTTMNTTDRMLTNVVFYDQLTDTAGIADVVILNRVGHFKILKIQINEANVMTKNPKSWIKGVLKQDLEKSSYYQDKIDLEEGNLLKDDKLTLSVQDQVEVGLIRRMAQNQGYDIVYGDNAVQSLILSYKGKALQFHGHISHPQFQNDNHVDSVIPYAAYTVSDDEVKKLSKDLEEGLYDVDRKDSEIETLAEQVDPSLYPAESTISVALDNYYEALVDEARVREMTEANIFSDRSKEDHKETIANTLAYINVAKAEGPVAQSVAYTKILRDSLTEMKKFSAYVIDPKNVAEDPNYIRYVMNFNKFLTTFDGLYLIEDNTDINATQRSLIGQINIELVKLLGAPTIKGNGEGEGIVNQAILNYVYDLTLQLSQDGMSQDKNNILQSHSGKTFTVDDIEDILKMVPDIDGAELYSKDLATSADFLLSSMDKIFKIKRIEFLDKVKLREKRLREGGAAILSLDTETDLQKLYDFMLEFDEEGNFTGLYTQRIGQQYYSQKTALRDELYDINGKPIKYRPVHSLVNAKQKDLDYNKQVYLKRKAFGDFMNAEVYEDGQLRSGKYHKYTDDFIKIRAKFEYFQPWSNGEGGNWVQKSGVSKQAYESFRRKYYQEQPYTKMYKDAQKDPTGVIIENQSYPSVRPDYVEAKDSYIDSKGQEVSLLSKKYEAIMNPTDALGQARKNFYDIFISDYESMLNALPKSVRNKMLGKVPIIRNNLVRDLTERPPIFTKLLPRMVRSVRQFFTTTSTQRIVQVDNDGNLIDTLPVYYTGSAGVDGALEQVQNEMEVLRQERKEGKITLNVFEKKRAQLEAQFASLRNKPTKCQLEKDLVKSMIKFSTMAENFEAMSEIEDSLQAIVKVIEMRQYQAPGATTYVGKLYDKAKGSITKEVGKKNYDGLQSNAARRAHHYMKMTFYDNDQITQGAIEKTTNLLVNASSLAYVAFNVFGNFNNLTIGQLNNAIEAMGGLYFTGQGYKRAQQDFAYTAVQGIIQRTPDTIGDFADFTGRVATLNKVKLKKGNYDIKKPLSLYEWLSDHYYMMDNDADIRETFSGREDTGTLWERFTSFGYSFNQGAEYYAQSTVGHAILYSTFLTDGNETLSIREAWDWDAETQTATLKEGFDTVIDKRTGFTQPYNNTYRARLRNRIREVNKQIHGNYAREDRMVIQNNFLGILIAQFHKWVMPAFRARFQQQYYDQNLGWIEGRYKSMYKFIKYLGGVSKYGGKVMQGQGMGSYGTNLGASFKEAYGYSENLDGEEFYDANKGNMLLKNVYRTLGEAFLIMNLFILTSILKGADDDDEGLERKLKNFIAYTAVRSRKEMVMFVPVPGLGGFQQLYQMAKTPIASTRTLGELGEAMELTVQTPIKWLFLSDEEFLQDSSIVYQNKPRKGELKLAKNWYDVLPLLYSIQKYFSFEKNNDFYIK